MDLQVREGALGNISPTHSVTRGDLVASSQTGSIGERLRRAVLHPVAIGSAIAAALSLAFGQPGLAVAFGLIWLGTVAVKAGRGPAVARAPEISHLPPSIQADLMGVMSARDQLQVAARSVPAEQRPLFEGIEREAEELRGSVLQLGLSAGALHRRLETMRPEQMAAEEAALRARLEATSDEVARGQLEASLADHEQRVERRQRLLGRLERYRATIKSLETTAAEIVDRATDLAAGVPMEYDAFGARSPERKVSEMKASAAAREDVLGAETETR